MNIESIINNFDVLTDSKNGVQRLRELIRDLAIKGQLIENPDKSICGTVGSHGPLPSSWRWVKIEEVADFVNGFAFRSDEYISNGVGVVRMSDMKNGEINPVGMKFVSADRLKSLDSNFQVKPNDIVMGMTGATLGKPCVNRTSEVFLLNQRIGKFVPKDIDPDYLLLALANLENSFMRLSFGTGVNNLSTRQIKDSLLPLPPRGMQSEIVKAVAEMYKTCDKLESGLNSKRNLASLARKSAINAISTAHTGDDLDIAWDRIQKNWDVIAGTPEAIESLRDLILSLAVSGELSRQLRTTNESNSLLPIDWELKEFSEVANFSIGKTPPTKETKYWGGEDSIMWVSIGDMQNGGKVLETNRRISPSAQSEIFRRSPWPPGTMLMSFKLTIGKVSRLASPAFFNEAIFAFDSGNEVTNEFLFRVLPFISQRADSKGVIKGNTLNSQSIRKMLIPIPPIDEQSRLVNIIDQLNQFCDDLESQLSTHVSLAEKFARSIVSQAG